MNDDTQAPETFAPEHSSAIKTFVKTPKGKLTVAIVVVAVGLSLLTVSVYARPVTDSFVRTMASIFPLPAFLVDGKIVTIKEFLTEYDALEQYFEDLGEQVPPVEQLEIAIADTLINKIAIQKLATQYGVDLDKERVEQYYQDVISAQENEKVFEENIARTFGWTVEEFKSRIVESIVLALQMTDVVLADTQTQQPRFDLANVAYERIQAGEDFATVAKDAHANFDGIQSDLGYVKVSVIPESWSSQVVDLEEGQTTEIIEMLEGYAVFKLEEKILAGEDTQLHLLSIMIPKVSLEEVVEKYLATVKVKRFVGGE